MSRSKWKGPYINPKHLNLKKANPKKNVYFMSKNSEIVPKFAGLDFQIYNGRKYIDISVIDSMIGHKFGEFVPTRAKFVFKKKSKK